MGQDPRAPHYSPDGHWWWDGMAWRPVAPIRPAGGMPTGAIIALIAGVVVLVLITVSVLGYVAFTRIDASLRSSKSAGNGIPCDRLEHTLVHYHVALQILVGGTALPIPTAVGRTSSCYYWLHMHSDEPDIIHIEAPYDRTFTLADFFQVWSAWSGQKELIDTNHVSTFSLSSGQKLVAYVDTGGGAMPVTGDPATIVLQERQVITLEVTPPTVDPPPAFEWPQGF